MSKTDPKFRIEPVAAPVREQVAASIRRALMVRYFQPGQRLPERELCELTGASRTAVREALRDLEAEGLIETVPHRGPSVVTLDAVRAAGIYDLRLPLEGLLARRAAERASAETDHAVVVSRDRLAVAFEAADPLAVVAAKTAFYDALMLAADNPDLAAVLRRYIRLLSLFWPTMVVESGEGTASLAEIDAVIAAIAARDPDAADAAMRLHISSAAAQTLRWLGQVDAGGPA
ncbi:GntR family transcriptional regulator [Pseudooceanicola sp. C21-150M6]|uniref:GntR family transcriptional regulator n=1 Tax=Pseudooceanicola sp. C21-150M6 TaxID=3434355 RepID=UPI003D7F4B58